MDTGEYTLESILRSMRGSQPASGALVLRAYSFADQAHAGQTRLSGEPYLKHLAATALYLARAGSDATTVAAGLLHDILEDTAITAAELGEAFGEEVLFLVQGVTRIGTYKYQGPEGVKENLHRLLEAAAQDVRVIAIKLNDRLHNMQTNSFHVPERALRKAEETMNTYVPLAKRLCMGRIQRELEDLAFQHLDKPAYERMQALMRKEKKARHEGVVAVAQELLQALEARYQVVSLIEVREKGLWSLHQKIERKNGEISEIHDMLAVRIVVLDRDACYSALGAIHARFKPIPGQFKDYISFPKPSGYQSLHTKVITPQAGIVEVQIRSRDMHAYAQFGRIHAKG